MFLARTLPGGDSGIYFFRDRSLDQSTETKIFNYHLMVPISSMDSEVTLNKLVTH